jgi:hypothetical protein
LEQSGVLPAEQWNHTLTLSKNQRKAEPWKLKRLMLMRTANLLPSTASVQYQLQSSLKKAWRLNESLEHNPRKLYSPSTVNTMKAKLKEATLLFAIQLVLYGIVCINYRAVALADYHEAAITDFVLASLNFFVIRKIAKSDDTLHQWIGYVMGSVAGSYIGIWLSVILN